MSFEWMRTRPPAIQALMRRFPPVCRVRATHPLCIPVRGAIGRVVSYIEPDDDHPDGSVTVMHEAWWFADGDPSKVHGIDAIRDPNRGECRPEWLEVVQYDGNKTPEWVERVLWGEDLEPTNPGLDGLVEGECP